MDMVPANPSRICLPQFLHGTPIHPIFCGRRALSSLGDGVFLCVRCAKSFHRAAFQLLQARDDMIFHAGHCQSCDEELWRIDAPEADWPGLRRFCQRLLAMLLHSAAKRETLVLVTARDLARRYVEQGGLCAYTGLPLERAPGEGEQNRRKATVIRIDQAAGYVYDNLEWIGWGLFRLRGELSRAVFFDLCTAVAEHRRSRMDALDAAIMGESYAGEPPFTTLPAA